MTTEMKVELAGISESFFGTLRSIPLFNPETSVKDGKVFSVKFGGTEVDVIVDSKMLIVTGTHAEIVFSFGRRLRAPFCYWNSNRNETVIAFGKTETIFMEKCKMLLMICAILPITLMPEIFTGKKAIVYKHYGFIAVSVFITNEGNIFVKESDINRPYIRELSNNMEEKFNDPKSAEEEIDKLTEASKDEDPGKDLKPKAVYGEAVEQE